MIGENIRKHCNIGDVNLVYYDENENESSNTVLIIHGNSMDSVMMKKMFNYLSRFYRVIAVDSRGHGKSENGEKAYSIELFAEDMAKFCENKLLNNIIIIGYSDGANVALAIAYKYPELAEKIILICGNYNATGVKWLIRMPILGLKSITNFMKKFVPKMKFILWKIKLMIDDYGMDKNKMKQIKTNILIIAAKYDFVYRQHQIDMNRYLKNSYMHIIEGTNHFNVITSEKTFKAIKKFIDGK